MGRVELQGQVLSTKRFRRTARGLLLLDRLLQRGDTRFRRRATTKPRIVVRSDQHAAAGVSAKLICCRGPSETHRRIRA